MIFKVNPSIVYMLVAFGLLSIAAIIYFNYVPVDDAKYVSTDSTYYRELSLNYCDEPFAPIVQVFQKGGIIGLNWATIVTVGAFSCALTEQYSDWVTLSINLVLLFCTLFMYEKIMNRLKFSDSKKIVFYLLFCMQTFLIVSLVSLNKEVFSYLFLVSLLYFYIENNRAWLLLAALFAGFLKVQFFLLGLMLIAMVMNIKVRTILIVVSLILPIIFVAFDPSVLDARQYYARYGYQIRTEDIAVILNDMAAYPFGYIVVMPLRLLINALSGLSPFRLIAADDVQSIAYQANAVIFSIFSIFLLWKVMREKKYACRYLGFILAYSIIISLLPFFQLRYFLPLFPVIIMTLLMPRRQGNWINLNGRQKVSISNVYSLNRNPKRK